MVTSYDMRKALNNGLLNSIRSVNLLNKTETPKPAQKQLMITEKDYYITERSKRVESGVAAAFDLSKHKRNFLFFEIDDFDIYDNQLEEVDLSGIDIFLSEVREA